MFLSVQVQPPGAVRGGEVDGERVGLGVVAGVAVVRDVHSAPFGVLAAVEGEAAHAEHGLGHRVQPPVDQVEVVGALVHQQSSRLVLLTVPSAEVVGAVARVEQVGQVDVDDLTDRALPEQLSDERAAGPPPVVEGHRQRAAGAADRVHDRAALRGVDGHGLLGDRVAAPLHRPDDVPMVECVDRRHDDGVRTGPPDHVVEVGRVEGLDRPAAKLVDDVAVVVLHPGWVRVADPDQLAVVLEPARHGVHERQPSAARTNHRVPFTSRHAQASPSCIPSHSPRQTGCRAWPRAGHAGRGVR